MTLNISDPDRMNICITCGTRYSAKNFDAKVCKICSDSRQYVKSYGQKWTSYERLCQDRTIKITPIGPGIYELVAVPNFGIGQRAFFMVTPHGNLLWDCIPVIDEVSVAFLKSKGGIDVMAISHPHYYSLMAEWAKAFECPIYLHQNDSDWVVDDDSHVIYFKKNSEVINDGVKIIRTGGHFSGSTILHYQSQNPRGTLFIADSLFLSRDKKHLSAMYSYPNRIPLSKKKTLAVFDTIKNLQFDAVYGGFKGQDLHEGARDVFNTSHKIYMNL